MNTTKIKWKISGEKGCKNFISTPSNFFFEKLESIKDNALVKVKISHGKLFLSANQNLTD